MKLSGRRTEVLPFGTLQGMAEFEQIPGRGEPGHPEGGTFYDGRRQFVRGEVAFFGASVAAGMGERLDFCDLTRIIDLRRGSK